MNCPNCGTEIEGRTSPQNRYFHKILTIWGKEIGDSLEAMKCTVKEALGLCKEAESKITGRKIMVYESSSDWDKDKFGRVIDWVIREAGSQGVELPEPPTKKETANN